jgi:hypothetical protein
VRLDGASAADQPQPVAPLQQGVERLLPQVLVDQIGRHRGRDVADRVDPGLRVDEPQPLDQHDGRADGDLQPARHVRLGGGHLQGPDLAAERAAHRQDVVVQPGQ